MEAVIVVCILKHIKNIKHIKPKYIKSLSVVSEKQNGGIVVFIVSCPQG